MRINPAYRHRRSVRLPGYDYSRPGAYFVTVCVQNRECLFGKIINGKMVLNDAGKIVEKWHLESANKFPHIICDKHIVMPNHFHTIITIAPAPIVGANLRVRPPDLYVPPSDQGRHIGLPLRETGPRESGMTGRKPANVSAFVQWFKTMTTNEYIRNVKTKGWPAFNKKLWQRDYYEHIIRNEKSMFQVRQYIRCNPLNCNNDDENPMCKSPRYL